MGTEEMGPNAAAEHPEFWFCWVLRLFWNGEGQICDLEDRTGLDSLGKEKLVKVLA